MELYIIDYVYGLEGREIAEKDTWILAFPSAERVCEYIEKSKLEFRNAGYGFMCTGIRKIEKTHNNYMVNLDKIEED